jgi:hypothetical protein
MSLAMDLTRHTAETADTAPASRESGETEFDLERLVWDPEYRAAMRPLLRHDS